MMLTLQLKVTPIKGKAELDFKILDEPNSGGKVVMSHEAWIRFKQILGSGLAHNADAQLYITLADFT